MPPELRIADRDEGPRIELRMEEDGSCGVFVQGWQLGALVAEGTNLRLILGSTDIGGGLNIAWAGDAISLRFDLSVGLDYHLGGQR